MKWWVFLLLLVVVSLSACGGMHRESEVRNPYVDRFDRFTQAGMTAMQRERWKYARISFERSLTAARLTDDAGLVARAWYNLGMARKSGGGSEAAAEAFEMARKSAERAKDRLTVLRAGLALALLQNREDGWYPASLRSNLPADVHLSAARLAQQQHRWEMARGEYRRVIKADGSSRQGMIYRGQAHLGLGMVAREKGGAPAAARDELQQALALFRQAGAPKLIAYTLLLLSESDAADGVRADRIRRAMAIYRVMHDKVGEQACMQALQEKGG